MRKGRAWSGRWGILCIFLMLAGCGGQPSPTATQPFPSATPTCPSRGWTVLERVDFGQPTLAVMFRDGQVGIATDLQGGIHYTVDGGKSWNYATRAGFSRVALEMNTPYIWHIGYGGAVSRSQDEGHSWQEISSVPHGGHVEYMSFADEMNGWVVSTERSEIFITRDGAKTWESLPFPEKMGRPAALALRTPSDGYLLDTGGNLFITSDAGKTWTVRSLPLAQGVSIPVLNHSAAMRFTDGEHGLIALSLLENGKGRTLGLRTEDGGVTWVEEALPVPMGMFHLTRDGIFLTHVDLIEQGKITVLCSGR
jgi:hypothetical protein